MSWALFLKIICQRDSPLKHAANTPNKNTANIQQMTNILILSNQFLSVVEPVSRDASYGTRTSFIWTQKYQSILSHVYLPVLQSDDCYQGHVTPVHIHHFIPVPHQSFSRASHRHPSHPSMSFYRPLCYYMNTMPAAQICAYLGV
jgi:hypothetical protein